LTAEGTQIAAGGAGPRLRPLAARPRCLLPGFAPTRGGAPDATPAEPDLAHRLGRSGTGSCPLAALLRLEDELAGLGQAQRAVEAHAVPAHGDVGAKRRGEEQQQRHGETAHKKAAAPASCSAASPGRLEPRTQDRLARWFWCGVFGELYGS